MSRLFGSSVTVSSFISPDKAAAEDPGAPGPRGPAGYRACASWGRVGPRGPGRPRESSAESCSSSHLCRLVCSKKKKCRRVQRSQGWPVWHFYLARSQPRANHTTPATVTISVGPYWHRFATRFRLPCLCDLSEFHVIGFHEGNYSRLPISVCYPYICASDKGSLR